MLACRLFYVQDSSIQSFLHRDFLFFINYIAIVLHTFVSPSPFVVYSIVIDPLHLHLDTSSSHFSYPYPIACRPLISIHFIFLHCCVVYYTRIELQSLIRQHVLCHRDIVLKLLLGFRGWEWSFHATKTLLSLTAPSIFTWSNLTRTYGYIAADSERIPCGLLGARCEILGKQRFANCIHMPSLLFSTIPMDLLAFLRPKALITTGVLLVAFFVSRRRPANKAPLVWYCIPWVRSAFSIGSDADGFFRRSICVTV